MRVEIKNSAEIDFNKNCADISSEIPVRLQINCDLRENVDD